MTRIQNFLLFSLILGVNCQNSTEIINVEVNSEVDLQKELAFRKDKIEFVNDGPVPIKTYLYAIDEPETHFVAFFNRQGKELTYYLQSTKDHLLCEVILDKSVDVNIHYKIIAKIAWARKIKPAIKKRKINDDQLMRFEGNLRFSSPYRTMNLKIQYLVNENSVVEVSQEPMRRFSGKLVYWFTDLPPFSSERLHLVFINNNAFLTIENLERTIDISHFGRISIEDQITVKNIGPILEGPISPQKERKGVTHWLFTHLPASADNIKFFDNLGNSSQTRILYFNEYATLKFKPRYPLYGGWKTTYNILYDVPTYEYLFTTLYDSFLLKIRAVDHVLNEVIIENANIKIVLPEGARLGEVKLPKYLMKIGEELSCLGGLCLLGRPTLVLHGSNLFENHVGLVDVNYYFHPGYLVRAPLVISIYFELIFLIVLLCRRTMCR